MKLVGSAIAKYFRVTDKWLLLFWVGASALSVLFLCGLYTSEYASEDTVKMQVYASLLGLGSAIIISLIDYRILLKLWKLYVPLCVIMVGLTFFASFSTIRGDNQAWLTLPIGDGISVQPAEFLKISFITTMAIHINKVRENLNSLSHVLLLCAHGGAHILLIQAQGDTGTALVFMAIFAAMLFCAGINWRYVAAAAAASVPAVILMWFYVLSDDQKMRILVLQNPEISERYAYQQAQGISALGFGGMRGTGIFAGQHIYVPEAYNDFIFTFIGQSAGFIGCLGVMALLMAISFKLLYNSRLATDEEGRLICVGMFAMILSQLIINVGMCLSVLPVIGVTLPLFSSGGSSVLSLYIGLGFVLSVYCHPETSLFQSKENRL